MKVKWRRSREATDPLVCRSEWNVGAKVQYVHDYKVGDEACFRMFLYARVFEIMVARSPTHM